jgi:hypothetical protein
VNAPVTPSCTKYQKETAIRLSGRFLLGYTKLVSVIVY